MWEERCAGLTNGTIAPLASSNSEKAADASYVASATRLAIGLAGVMLARVGWSTINGALMPVAMLCIVAMGLLLLAERRSPAPQP